MAIQKATESESAAADICGPYEGECGNTIPTPGNCWQNYFSEYEGEIKTSWAQIIANSGFAPLGCLKRYYVCTPYTNVPVPQVGGWYYQAGYYFHSWRWECPSKGVMSTLDS